MLLRRSAARVAPTAASRAPAGVRVFCSAPKDRALKSAEIPLHVGVGAGGVAGVISALTGVGGGLILIPVRARIRLASSMSC